MQIPMSHLVSLLAVAASAIAQAPAPEQLAQQAHGLAQQLAQLGEIEKPSDEQKAQLAAKQQELAVFVATCVKGEGFDAQHFIEASSPLLEGNPQEALAIAEAGIAKFPDSRFLFDHVGFAHSRLALAMRPTAARLAGLRAAESAFRKALQCKPDTWHAHLGLYQVLDHLGTCDEALRELDTAQKDAEGAAALTVPWRRRATLLMRSGKAKDAIAILKAATPGDDDEVDRQILLLRAAALAKDAATMEATTKQLRGADDSPRMLVEVADALACAGRKDDALKLLGARPARSKFETEDERVEQLHLQSAAALELVLKTTDWGAKGPTRVALTKALGHSFNVMDPSSKPPKNVDLSSSPAAMASLCANQPASEPKDWGNRILLVLCLRALPGYKPEKFESTALGAQRAKASVDDIPALIAAARFAIGDPDQTGVLAGARVLEQLAGPAAPAKK